MHTIGTHDTIGDFREAYARVTRTTTTLTLCDHCGDTDHDTASHAGPVDYVPNGYEH